MRHLFFPSSESSDFALLANGMGLRCLHGKAWQGNFFPRIVDCESEKDFQTHTSKDLTCKACY
jgi:hypothetical protein